MTILSHEFLAFQKDLARRLSHARSEEWKKPKTGYFCTSRTEFEIESETHSFNCNKCDRCLARIKDDWAARCLGESFTSEAVVLVTLTYRNDEAGHREFIVKDRQLFQKQLRNRLKREGNGTAVRYVVAGERGENGSKRCHWHYLLFLDGPHSFVTTAQDEKGHRRAWDDQLWPRGHICVDVIPMESPDDIARSVRYVTKYIRKAVPKKYSEKKTVARFGFSQGRIVDEDGNVRGAPIGTKYCEQYARDVARQGLPLHGHIKFPGIKRGTGERAKTAKHNLFGVVVRYFIAAYKEAWREFHGDRDIPPSDFMIWNDEEWVMRIPPSVRLNPIKWHKGVKPPEPLPDLLGRDCSGYLPLRSRRGTFDAYLTVSERGVVSVEYTDTHQLFAGVKVSGIKLPLYLPALDLRRSEIERAEEFVRERWGGVSPDEFRAMLRARRDAAARALTGTDRSPEPVSSYRHRLGRAYGMRNPDPEGEAFAPRPRSESAERYMRERVKRMKV